MFFEGALVPDVCSTVLLTGGSLPELTKIKRILSFMVLTEYNWRFEKSFLMDEFARPPSPPPEIFLDSPMDSPTVNKTATVSSRVVHKISAQPSSTPLQPIKDDLELSCNDSSVLEEPELDQSDPLLMTDRWVCPPDDVRLSVAELPRGNKFRSALDDTILSISPFLKLNVPYLESDSGRNCRLRTYFPIELFYSKQFSKQEKELKASEKDAEMLTEPNFLPKHEFLTVKMVDEPGSGNIQTLLALYRANGGRIPLGYKGEVRKPKTKVEKPKLRDVLDPFEHQNFSMLFCVYSAYSAHAPAFCVDPW